MGTTMAAMLTLLVGGVKFDWAPGVPLGLASLVEPARTPSGVGVVGCSRSPERGGVGSGCELCELGFGDELLATKSRVRVGAGVGVGLLGSFVLEFPLVGATLFLVVFGLGLGVGFGDGFGVEVGLGLLFPPPPPPLPPPLPPLPPPPLPPPGRGQVGFVQPWSLNQSSTSSHQPRRLREPLLLPVRLLLVSRAGIVFFSRLLRGDDINKRV